MYQSARILLVGGDLPVRQATRRFLRKAGYEVAETGTGEECLRLAQAQRPDLILLDTVLPDMDGVEVCRRIKAEPALVGCLILLAGTINTSSDNRARGLEAGAEGWIIRPISNRELLLQVGVMLRFKQAEERLVHLNAILRAVRSVNQLIVRGKDRAWLLREACRSLIQAGSYSGAWIALWDESGALVTAEEAGLAEYSSALVERLERGEARLYCAQVALQQADVLCIEQALSNCGDCPLISVCQSSKAMAIRLEYGGKVYGLLFVSTPDGGSGGEAERDLLGEVAGDIAFALRGIELEEERGQAERVVQEAREYAESIIATVREPLVVLDADLRVVSASRAFYQTFQVILEETEGRLLYDLGNRQWDIPQLRLLLEAVLLEDMAFDDFGMTLDFPHLGSRTMVLNARRIYREGERTELILLAIEDITDRKRVEEERESLLTQVREQARQMVQVLAAVPAGVLLLDAGGRVLQVNPMVERDLAALVEVKVGAVLTHLGDRSLSELLTSPPKGLWHEVKADQHIFEVIAQPVENGAKPEHWVLVIKDVTRERQIRQQLQHQERLAAVGQLAAGIAHDFNNIIATIILYAQMAGRSEELSERTREWMVVIIQQAWHATRLIEQILDFSRRSVLERQPLDLLPLLKEQVKLLKRTLPEHIQIELDCGQDEYTVYADPTRMQQMVMNLAVNARDAMPEGGTLRIGLERIVVEAGRSPLFPEMEAGEWIRLTVSDTGMGIAPDVLPHIFEPFFTTKEPGQGTGLGLAQVHGIVGQHGGHIGVETEAGKGTTFLVYLPVLKVGWVGPSPLYVSSVPLGHGEVVLVVEDEAALRAALVATLEGWNYRTLEAANGREALALMEEQGEQVALVLSDVVMPVVGGLALFRALREKGWRIPVILLTGHPMERELEALREEGPLAWMLKPPALGELAQMLADMLQG